MPNTFLPKDKDKMNVSEFDIPNMSIGWLQLGIRVLLSFQEGLRMAEAFRRENVDPFFDWAAHYGEGDLDGIRNRVDPPIGVLKGSWDLVTGVINKVAILSIIYNPD